MNSNSSVIVTAASADFAPSLLSLLGSLNLNWPGHPPIVVYDIGLDPSTVALLSDSKVTVKAVPPFCPHWRNHFTWKIWCINDAEASNVLWMDAGLVVLADLDEVYDAIDRLGYFLTTNRELLDWEASEAACSACGLPIEFRNGKLTLAATLMGFRKVGIVQKLLQEALSVALVEKNIAASEVTHRHDQAIISLLVYKYLRRVVIADQKVYLGSLSPQETAGQKVWVHRRRIQPSDAERLAAHIVDPGMPFIPSSPYSLERAQSLAHLYRVYWNYGLGRLTKAEEHLQKAFNTDSTLRSETELLASKLCVYHRRLEEFRGSSQREGFMRWVTKQLYSINGVWFSVRFAIALNRIREGASHSQL